VTLLWSAIVVPSLQVIVRPRIDIVLHPVPKSYVKTSARESSVTAARSTAAVNANARKVRAERSRNGIFFPGEVLPAGSRRCGGWAIHVDTRPILVSPRAVGIRRHIDTFLVR
jgi:hypothetical protein